MEADAPRGLISGLPGRLRDSLQRWFVDVPPTVRDSHGRYFLILNFAIAIGARKFICHMWGDMVNTASRIESHGLPDRIYTTRRFFDAARHAFDLERRGQTSIKGKRSMATYFMVARREGLEK